MARNTPWTRVDLQTLAELVIAGRANAYIADYLDRTISSIQTARARPEVQAAIISKPFTRAIEEPTDWPRKTLSAARKGKAWTEEENGNVIFLFAQGLPLEQIAESLKRTPAGVLARLKDYGLLEFNRDEMMFYRPATPYYKVKIAE